MKCYLKPGVTLPIYQSSWAAGLDLRAHIEDDVLIMPGATYMVPTGIHLEIPVGNVGLVYSRSGLSTKRGLALVNGVGVIDADYRGQVMVPLINLSQDPQIVSPKERVAQLVIQSVCQVSLDKVESLEDLSTTRRGLGGFGSTGSK